MSPSHKLATASATKEDGWSNNRFGDPNAGSVALTARQGKRRGIAICDRQIFAHEICVVSVTTLPINIIRLMQTHLASQ
jgi:hypothetical protein